MTSYRPTRRALQVRLLDEAVADNAALIGRGHSRLPSPGRRRRITLLAASLLAAAAIGWWTTSQTPRTLTQSILKSASLPLPAAFFPAPEALPIPLPSPGSVERATEVPAMAPVGGLSILGSGAPAEPAHGPVARDAEPRLANPVPMARGVLPLAVRTIALDPGHGGESMGTELPSGLKEKELTLDIAMRLRAMLESSGYRVVMTRSEDRDLTLEERSDLANQSRADLLLSIHVNWIQKREVRGIETYYLGSSSEPELEELARLENQNSGYRLADRPLILDRIYQDLRRDDSHRLASAVQAALVRELRRTNPQLEDRGVKSAPFVVLAGAEMPSILAEVSCLSNDSEAELLQRPEYRHRIALALATGLAAYAADVSGMLSGQ